jgi:hypothetical protein
MHYDALTRTTEPSLPGRDGEIECGVRGERTGKYHHKRNTFRKKGIRNTPAIQLHSQIQPYIPFQRKESIRSFQPRANIPDPAERA